MRDGAELLDIRSDSQRASDGTIPGAAFVPRDALEWRLDLTCPDRDERLALGTGLLMIICKDGLPLEPRRRDGSASERVAVTDVIGGFQGPGVRRAFRSIRPKGPNSSAG